MTATEKLMALDPTKGVVAFGDGTNHQFVHSDLDWLGQPTGISTEEIEFLYGLIRLLRPANCLETGTNYGCSASAILLGLKDNEKGSLVTIEHDATVAGVANSKLTAMGFTNFQVYLGSVASFQSNEMYDFLWLDTELATRFGELVRFFPQMNPGAIACIHDLWSLDWSEFGGIPDRLRDLLRSGELRALTFATPHGVTVFQRRREHDALADIALAP